MRGKLKKEFVRKVVVAVVFGLVVVVVVEVELVEDTMLVVPAPPPPSTKPDVVVVTVSTVVEATAIVPVQKAPVGQQATWLAKSKEHTAFFVQQEPRSAAARVEQEL